MISIKQTLFAYECNQSADTRFYTRFNEETFDSAASLMKETVFVFAKKISAQERASVAQEF